MEEQIGYGQFPTLGKKSSYRFRKKYPELAYEFQQIQEEQYELFASKMMDYGLQNIALGSICLEKEEDISLIYYRYLASL
jgi:hypothetical protein